MAASTKKSMGGNKRKLGDLSVDEFMSGGFESSSSESEKAVKIKKKNKGSKIKSQKLEQKSKVNSASKTKSGVVSKKGVVSGHKSSLSKLKDQDPEFYEFLKDEDESLLNFGELDESDVSDSSDDDDTSKPDELGNDIDSDDEDIPLPESSDEELDPTDSKINTNKNKKNKGKDAKDKSSAIESDKNKKKQTVIDKKKQVKESKKEANKSEKGKEGKKKKTQVVEEEEDDDSEDDIDFDMEASDDSDEEGMLHRTPESLEVMSNSDDDEDDDDDGGQQKKTKGALVTMNMIKEWTDRFRNQLSPQVLHDAVYAFKAAVQHTATETVATKYKVEGGKVFNGVVKMCLVEIPSALQRLLDLPTKTDLEQPTLPSTKSKKWKKIKLDVKSYLGDVLQLMMDLSDANMVNVLLKHIHKLVSYYACYPKLTKIMLKRVINVWSTGEETSRVLAFLCVNRIIRIKQEDLLESCIKQLYMAYVKNCKFTSPNSLPLINFMQRSLVEILSLDYSLAYQYAFIYIRQLAIHLRNAISTKKKESCHAVYNWQYIHCIGLWGRVISLTHPNVILEPLIYPLVQTIIGTIKLIPTQRYYPLRFHCVKVLTMISQATDTFIPVLPFLLEVFEQTDFNKKHKSISFKPFNFACILKLSKTQLQEKSFKDGVIDMLYELLLEHFHVHAHTIGFPELVLPAMLQMKDFLKKCKVSNFTKQIRQIVDKVDENAKYISTRRRSVTISLSDTKAIVMWERECESSIPPLGKFYSTWRKLRDRELMHAIAGRDEIVGKDGLPKLNKPKGPVKATDEEKKEFSALFDSDSDDDTDHTQSFLPPDEKKKAKQDKKKKQQLQDEDDYSDFDSDDLAQLDRSASEGSDSDDDDDVEMDDDDKNDDSADDVEKDNSDIEDDESEGADDIVQDFKMSSDEED